MRFFKLLIFLLVFLVWVGKGNAQRAFSFGQSFDRCEGTSFSTSTFDFSSNIRNLIVDGWYKDGVKLVSGTAVTIDVPSSGSVTITLRSSANGVSYSDPLTITAVQRPELSVPTSATICEGESVTFQATTKNSITSLTWSGEPGTFNEGESVKLTQNTLFDILAYNNACDDKVRSTFYVTVNKKPDTASIGVNNANQFDLKLCPGCKGSLNDFVSYYGEYDGKNMNEVSWTKIGGGLVTDPESIIPPTSGTAIYQGRVTGEMYKTNSCGTLTKAIDVKILVNVSKASDAECKIKATWTDGSGTLQSYACMSHRFVITNPQKDGYQITNISYTSTNNYSITKEYESTSGANQLIYFIYKPEDGDDIKVTVTYVDKCAGDVTKTETYNLSFRITPNAVPKVNAGYCKGDTLQLMFYSDIADLYLRTVDIEDRVKDDFRYLGSDPPSGDKIQNMYYSYKDVVYDWNKGVFSAEVAYIYCKAEKTTTIHILPTIPESCYPGLYMTDEECRGDTNSITVYESRWPVAYIKSMKWIFPDGVQEFGEFDIDSFPEGRRYKLKLISYNQLPIGYEMVYNERGKDTTIKSTVANRTSVYCNPSIMLEKLVLCRGDSTLINITLNNKNGRIISTDWRLGDGKYKVDSLNAALIPYGKGSKYYYSGRFQKSGNFYCKVTYSCGDSIWTFEQGYPYMQISSNCDASVAHPKLIYCKGDNIPFTIKEVNLIDTILSVRWEPSSPVKFDSSSTTKRGTHYYSSIAQQDTTFRVFVTGRDYFGDSIDYEVVNSPTSFRVKPYPRIWKHKELNVCRDNPVFMDTCWNTTMVKPNGVEWGGPPFYGDKMARLREGDSSRSYIAVAYPAYTCIDMDPNAMIEDTITLVWNKTPMVKVESFPITCVNDTVELFAQFDIIGTITWVKNADTIIKDRKYGEMLRDVVTDSLWYTAINTTACGTISDRQFLRVKPAPQFTVHGDTNVCLNDSATLYIMPDPSSDPQVIGTPEWYAYGSKFNAETLRLPIRDTSRVFVTVMAMGDNSCKGKGTLYVDPMLLPKIKVSLAGTPTGDSIMCTKMSSSTFTLKAYAEGALSYLWILPETYRDSTTDSIEVPPIDTTTVFRVEGKDANGCKNQASFYVTVWKPDGNMRPDNTDTVCERQAYEFTAAEITDMKFFWQLPDKTTIESPTLRIDSMTSADAGIYKLIRFQYECYDTTDFTLKAKPTPNPKVLTYDSALCENTKLEMLAETLLGATYYWRTPGNVIEHSESINIPMVSQADEGKYNFVVTFNNCTDSIAVNVRVDVRTSPSIQLLDRMSSYYCDSDPIRLAYLPGGADLYVLKLPSGVLDTNVNPSTVIGCPQYSTDSGTVMLLVNKLTCQDTVYRNLDIRYRPNPQLAYNSQYCAEDTIRIAVDPEPGVFYQWQGPKGFKSNQSGIALNKVDVSNAGDYYLTAMLNGCSNYPDTAKIVIYPLPVVNMSDYNYLCLGDTLTVNMYRPNADYAWNTGEKTSAIQVTKGGVYSVIVTENKCSFGDSVNIEERAKPVFELRSDTMVCYGAELRLHAGITGVNYYWSNGSTGEYISADEYIDIRKAGLYTLTTELRACKWTDRMQLFNRFCGALEMPTAFRPGSDILQNRVFRSALQVPKDLLVYELYIYDRWGKLMFQTDDIAEGWDGTYNGKACDPGVYIYTVNAHETIDGNDLSTKGTVVLVK